MKMKMQLDENDEQMISEPWMDETWEHMEHSEPDESMGGVYGADGRDRDEGAKRIAGCEGTDVGKWTKGLL
jgi:hypothetical protein